MPKHAAAQYVAGQDFQARRLGSRIQRSEIAAIAGVSADEILHYETGILPEEEYSSPDFVQRIETALTTLIEMKGRGK